MQLVILAEGHPVVEDNYLDYFLKIIIHLAIKSAKLIKLFSLI